MKYTLVWLMWLLLAAAVSLPGCSADLSSEDTPTVITSLPPHAWLTQQIADDTVTVLCMIGPADSPELFQPTDADISRASRARVYFRAGVPFEQGRWFASLTNRPSIRIVDLAEGVERRTIEGHHDHGHGHTHHHHHDEELDPHTWTSPPILRQQATIIAEALTNLQPEHGARYAANLARMLEALDELHADIRSMLAPYQGRSVFVFHPAWGYFTDEYGLNQVAIEVSGRSPADAELVAIQRQAREAGTRVIFVQPQINAQAATVVAHAIGGSTVSLDPTAEDVLANLRHVATAIRDSFAERADLTIESEPRE